MKILIACHEKVKKEKEFIFTEIKKYWEKAGFEVSYNIRNDENEIRTAIDVKKISADYLIIVDGLGFDTATTQGGLSYNNYAGIVLMLFLDSTLIEKYIHLEYGLNCYILISNPQFEIIKKSNRIHNVYWIPRYKNDYEWECFTEIRVDAVEIKRIAEADYNRATRLLNNLVEKERNQERMEKNINVKLTSLFTNELDTGIETIKDYLDKADKDMQLVYENKYQSLNMIMEIRKLEKKGNYPLLFCEQETWEALAESYQVFLSVLNRFVFPSVEADKEEGLQWIVSNHISPFAVTVALEREYDCKDITVYQYFATVYQALNDWKGAQIISAYAERYK